MEFKVYGHQGKPIIAFPTANGQFWQWEDMGMIDCVSPFINDGRIQVFAVDGIDWEHLRSGSWDHLASIHRYDQYMGYLREEFLPTVLDMSRRANGTPEERAIVTGASMGALHAANFFFHNPWQLDGVIALSGAYSLRHFYGDYLPDQISAYSPLDYLQGSFIDDRWLAYQRCKIVFCCGQGAWEEPMLTDTRLMGDLLHRRSIPAWIDIWGYDVEHDWPQWRKQLPYLLGNVLS